MLVLSDEIKIDSSKLEDEMVGINEYNVGARIKKYDHCQKARSSACTCVTTVEERFPILATLTPEFSRAACYLLLRESIEKVRYLSSTYLSMEEQGALAQGMFTGLGMALEKMVSEVLLSCKVDVQ